MECVASIIQRNNFIRLGTHRVYIVAQKFNHVSHQQYRMAKLKDSFV